MGTMSRAMAFVANESQAIAYFASNVSGCTSVVTSTVQLAEFARSLTPIAGGDEVVFRSLTDEETPRRQDWLRLSWHAKHFDVLYISSTFSAAHKYVSFGRPAGAYSYFDDGLATYTMRRVHTERSRVLRYWSNRVRKLEEADIPLDDNLFSEAHLYCPMLSSFSGKKHQIDKEKYKAVVDLAIRQKFAKLPRIPNSPYVLLALGGKGFDFNHDYIMSLISRLNTAGWHVVIKPHPRDDSRKLLHEESLNDGMTMVTGDFPIELLFGSHAGSIVAVVGPPTTALLTATQIYGLPSYYILQDGTAEIRAGDFCYSDCGGFLAKLGVQNFQYQMGVLFGRSPGRDL